MPTLNQADKTGVAVNLIKLIPPNADDFCKDVKTCPAVYDDLDSEEFAAIQGYLMENPPAGVPAGEGMVLFPKTLLRALAAQLAQL